MTYATLALVEREIIEIDESLCNGCGQCVPSCHEGALAIVDGKCRLVSEVYCDGLGACLGECPEGALKIVKRQAQGFDQRLVEPLVRNKDSGPCAGMPLKDKSCPGAMAQKLVPKGEPLGQKNASEEKALGLVNWPIQLDLVPAAAPFLDSRSLILAADCTGYAAPNFQRTFMGQGLPLILGCPKLSDIDGYIIKLGELLRLHPDILELKVVIMSVPCCRGLLYAATRGIMHSQRNDVLVHLFVVQQDGTIDEELPQKMER
ncbi:MAG: 4Fe-4S binding protein [Deltaproteobacteria bacterium]|jgi:ferredoxin|nr:4Fe-4S binding protein [Deltaproteobacteria bacterium]